MNPAAETSNWNYCSEYDPPSRKCQSFQLCFLHVPTKYTVKWIHLLSWCPCSSMTTSPMQVFLMMLGNWNANLVCFVFFLCCYIWNLALHLKWTNTQYNCWDIKFKLLFLIQSFQAPILGGFWVLKRNLLLLCNKLRDFQLCFPHAPPPHVHVMFYDHKSHIGAQHTSGNWQPTIALNRRKKQVVIFILKETLKVTFRTALVLDWAIGFDFRIIKTIINKYKYCY